VSGAASYADVVEGVRAAISRYTQALDDGRVSDVVDTFCADGICDIPGMGTHEGSEALTRAYTRWKPRAPQRHLVLNTLVTEWGQDSAHAVSDVVFILLGEGGWSIQVVGRYDDDLRRDGDRWLFQRRSASFVIPDPPKGEPR